MASEDYKIGVYVCECGPNIAEAVDIDRVLATISANPKVAVVKRHKLLCSNDGKDFLGKDIVDEGLTHVVVAACSPKDHEATFASVCESAGINPYLYKIINIREHCAWIIKDKEAATDKAIRYIEAGVSRVIYQSPLEQLELDSVPDVLVIGGGIAGVEAALSLASPERKVYIVEKSGSLGGGAAELAGLMPHQGTSVDIIREKIKAAQENENIEVLLESEVTQALGFFGNFEITVEKAGGESLDLVAGAIIVATGFANYDPSQNERWSCGKLDNVRLAQDIEKTAAAGELKLADGRSPNSVAMVHCVGRDEVGYCSAVCCNYLHRISSYVIDKQPDIKIHHLYRDLCLPNRNDQAFVEQLKDRGVNFVRAGDISISGGNNSNITINYSSASGDNGSLDVDMAVLAPAMLPGADTDKISDMLDLPLDNAGFFEEEHMLLAPVNTAVDGVFIVGCAQGPKDIPDSIVQAQSAAGAILSRLVPGQKLHPEVKVSEVIESLCTGCQTCVAVCSYGAAGYDENKRISVINEAICRGCGNCVGSCPSGAARAKHFTEKQLYQEVIEVM